MSISFRKDNIRSHSIYSCFKTVLHVLNNIKQFCLLAINTINKSFKIIVDQEIHIFSFPPKYLNLVEFLSDI